MGNEEIKSFTDLECWKKGHDIVLKIYQLSAGFPKEEIYGLTSQIRRAAVSITANIAEGFSRYHYKEKIHFYYNSRGSLTEVQDLLLIARDVGYLNYEKCKILFEQASEIRRLLNGLIRAAERQVRK